MSTTREPTSYDTVPYAGAPFATLHPDFLATRAALFGMTPAPPNSCRVLELGCGMGNNLLPLAVALPGASFLGIDLSPAQIALGRQAAEQLGLANVELRAASVLDLPGDLGTFDYILCHGVYSWVPPAAQEAILALCGRCLAPQGVAFLSYNTYPGWKVRGVVRDLLRLHTRGHADPATRIRQARALLGFLGRSVPGPGSAYQRLLQEETGVLAQVPDAYLFHEHLEEENHPVYFLEFVERAAAHGLQYLDDPDFTALYAELDSTTRNTLAGLCPDRPRREQYLDFLCNRAFRTSLLCQAGVSLLRAPSPEVVPSLWVRGQALPAEEQAGAGELPRQPLLRGALACLGEAWPRAVPFAALHELLAARPACPPGVLARLLLEAYLTGLVELHVHVPAFAASPGPRPLASRLARLQAVVGPCVVNLFHQTVLLTELDRVVLCRLDGTRDRADLLGELSDLADRGAFEAREGEKRVEDPARFREALESSLGPALERLAGHALLVG